MAVRSNRGAGEVARPKRGQLPPHNNSESPPTGDERETIVQVKGTLAYFEFVESVHTKTHIPKAQQFRLAYRDWCIANGHGEPPPI